ncbi:MAG: hypothetical protein MUD14_03485 [Hydrococcus sp. Prado102]|jgi:MFS family permease|nr:hypothetical protein [Hydrococcus sp. Prado102]
MTIAIATFILPTIGFTSLPVLYLVCVGFQFTYSMALVPLYALMMDNSRLGTAGFDFTLQVSIVFIGSLLAGAMSGFIATPVGYQGAFAISVALSLIGVALVSVALKPNGNNLS